MIWKERMMNAQAKETYRLSFQDVQPKSPFQAGDRIEISAGSLEVYRGEALVMGFEILESHSQWACARNHEQGFFIEFTRSYTQNKVLLYGHLAQDKELNGTENPPVGVWGADTPPPDGGDAK
jgi:hypothetical protein